MAPDRSIVGMASSSLDTMTARTDSCRVHKQYLSASPPPPAADREPRV